MLASVWNAPPQHSTASSAWTRESIPTVTTGEGRRWPPNGFDTPITRRPARSASAGAGSTGTVVTPGGRSSLSSTTPSRWSWATTRAALDPSGTGGDGRDLGEVVGDSLLGVALTGGLRDRERQRVGERVEARGDPAVVREDDAAIGRVTRELRLGQLRLEHRLARHLEADDAPRDLRGGGADGLLEERGLLRPHGSARGSGEHARVGRHVLVGVADAVDREGLAEELEGFVGLRLTPRRDDAHERAVGVHQRTAVDARVHRGARDHLGPAAGGVARAKGEERRDDARGQRRRAVALALRERRADGEA
jgi:hypothetical protein